MIERSSILCSICLLLLAGCGNPTPVATNQSPPPPPPAAHLAVWSDTWDGIPITMVGTDPSKPNAGTTTISATIIPVTLNFGGVAALSPTSQVCGDNSTAINRISQSPLFQNMDWPVSGPAGTIDLGITQFGDAFQRGNFWYYVSQESPNYHVILNPTVGAPIEINVPPQYGSLQANPACPNQPYGTVSYDFMNSAVQNAIASLHITADTLPIFITYDTSFPLSNGGSFLGFHSAFGQQTYIVASYMDEAFSALSGYNGTRDVAILSHEIGEWMDDPMGTNFVSPWGGYGIQQGCSNQLEVGDPLTGSVRVFNLGGFSYHIQELAFLSWFARDVPSAAVYNLYSTYGSFSSPAPPCS